MKYKRAIVWYRNDLRIHDHEALIKAQKMSEELLCVYCIDPRQWQNGEFGMTKTGVFRTQFLYESLRDLSTQLQAHGGELIIVKGKPEVLLPELVESYQIQALFWHKESTYEEIQVEDALEAQLFKLGVASECYWGSTLFHKEDLPFPISALPEIFTAFRKRAEKYVTVRTPLPAPADLVGIVVSELLQQHTKTLLEELKTSPEQDSRSAFPLSGGESQALAHLDAYLWQTDRIASYKETRNELLGVAYSSKFSAWLALGCISPRTIYQAVKAYEKERTKNSSTYWLIFELIWRDYFRFVSLKHGDKLFYASGIKGVSNDGHTREALFQHWVDGTTGIPFIDANMRELAATGFMSNRGRQNVASFLVHDLRIDWRMGAEYFESLLIDYDVCSNWGNWQYVAGIGNDPRENRYFNVLSQAKRYDPKGSYVKTWLPELAALPPQKIHTPFELSRAEQKEYGVFMGSTYPLPVVDFRGLRDFLARSQK